MEWLAFILLCVTSFALLPLYNPDLAIRIMLWFQGWERRLGEEMRNLEAEERRKERENERPD